KRIALSMKRQSDPAATTKPANASQTTENYKSKRVKKAQPPKPEPVNSLRESFLKAGFRVK
ncbi:MAG: hypothetical protein PVH64_09950, partial [Bacillota bacterium]